MHYRGSAFALILQPYLAIRLTGCNSFTITLQQLYNSSATALQRLCNVANKDGSSQQRVTAMWLQPQQTTMLPGCYPLEGLRIQNCQDAKALRVYNNVTTVAECNKYLVLNEIELQNYKRRLNSAILQYGATTFCRRLACAKLDMVGASLQPNKFLAKNIYPILIFS